MTHVVGVQGHGTCWVARTWHMLEVQGHGTYWGERTWYMLLGCKDMAHVGCKVVSYIQGNRAHVFNITQAKISER